MRHRLVHDAYALNLLSGCDEELLKAFRRRFSSGFSRWLLSAVLHKKEIRPSQTARALSGTDGEASTFDRCHTRSHGLALQVP